MTMPRRSERLAKKRELELKQKLGSDSTKVANGDSKKKPKPKNVKSVKKYKSKMGMISVDFFQTHKYNCYCRHVIKCPVLHDNDSYKFVRDTNNCYDSNAIAIYGSDTSDLVGYIPKYEASILAPLLDRKKIELKYCEAPHCTRSCTIFATVTKLTEEDLPSISGIVYSEYDEF
eukprot:UN00914